MLVLQVPASTLKEARALAQRLKVWSGIQNKA